MTLQKPYGYPAKDMLKDGRSIGVDVAVGKWLTREIGGRLKVNWENGIIDRGYRGVSIIFSADL